LVKTETEQIKDGIILRLHNNTSCAIVITTGTADKFYKPLPPKPTVKQIISRELDPDLPDGALVPQVQYSYTTRKVYSYNVPGDMFWGLRLLDGRSILFEVPFEPIELSFITELRLPYTYDWEQTGAAIVQGSGMESYVKFYNLSLPKEIKQKIKKR
jgi:hypothetical protein